VSVIGVGFADVTTLQQIADDIGKVQRRIDSLAIDVYQL